MRSTRGALMMMGLAIGACGSTAKPGTGPPPVVPAPGTFTWTVDNGPPFVATGSLDNTPLAAYFVGATLDGTAFGISLVGTLPSGQQCRLEGRFAAAVPPPVGTYPVVTGAAWATTDRAFTSTCITSAGDAGFTFIFASSGQVVLTKSEVGDVEGTFTLRGPGATVPLPEVAVAGGFNLACLFDSTDATHCGPLADVPAGGTCADLLACCNIVPDVPVCQTLYDMATPHGDAACGRVLTARRSQLCP